MSVDDDSDDEFGLDAATQQAMIEDGMINICNIEFPKIIGQMANLDNRCGRLHRTR